MDLQALNLTVDSEVAAEVGPLRYLSNLTGWSMDLVVNAFALLIVFVFDPLAVSLVVAYNRLHLREYEQWTIYEDKKKINEPLDKQGEEVLDLDEEIEEVQEVQESTAFPTGLGRDYRPD